MEYISKTAIKQATGLGDRRIAELVSDGVFQKGGKGMYAAASVYDYWMTKIESTKGTDHKAVKLEQDILKNKLMQLQIDEEEERLVDYNEMYAKVSIATRIVRDKILNIIPRVVPLIAAESDQNKITNILNSEIRSALNSFGEFIKND
jgi:hypothetical protein